MSKSKEKCSYLKFHVVLFQSLQSPLLFMLLARRVLREKKPIRFEGLSAVFPPFFTSLASCLKKRGKKQIVNDLFLMLMFCLLDLNRICHLLPFLSWYHPDPSFPLPLFPSSVNLSPLPHSLYLAWPQWAHTIR